MKLSLSQPNYREAFASRIRHDRLQRTHVVVGDHEPEPRIDWDAFDFSPRRAIPAYEPTDQ